MPPLFALWINTHGGVLAGIIVLVASATALTCNAYARKFAPDFLASRIEKGPTPEIGWWLWMFTALSVLALLANP